MFAKTKFQQVPRVQIARAVHFTIDWQLSIKGSLHLFIDWRRLLGVIESDHRLSLRRRFPLELLPWTRSFLDPTLFQGSSHCWHLSVTQSAGLPFSLFILQEPSI